MACTVSRRPRAPLLAAAAAHGALFAIGAPRLAAQDAGVVVRGIVHAERSGTPLEGARIWGQPGIVGQVQLVRADLLGAEALRRLAEVTGGAAT